MIEKISQECLSEWRLDCHRMGLETVAQREESLQHLDTCCSCQHFYDELCSHSHEEDFALLKEILIEKEEKYSLAEPSSLRSFWLRSQQKLAIAATFCLVFLGSWFYFKYSQKNRQQRLFKSRSSNHPILFVGLLRNGRRTLVPSGSALLPKDRVRLAYYWETKQPGYLFVIHQDPFRRFTPLYPAHKSAKSLSIIRSKEVALPGSLEADATRVGEETFWACFSKKPLHYQDVRSSIPAIPRKTGFFWKTQRVGACLFLARFVFQRRSVR